MPTTSHYDTFTLDAAEAYERYFVPVIPAVLADEMLDRAALTTGERVLDVACGTGIVARLAAERVGPDGTVIGVDIAPDMLDLARSLSAAARVPIEWRQGSAESLPVDDAAFDVALSQLGLMFVDDRPAAASELRRALDGGGRTVINVPGAIQPLNSILGEALARHISPQLEPFVHAVFSLDDPAELESLLTGAGFSDVATWTADTVFRLPPPVEFLWQYVSATPLGAAVGQAPEGARVDLERDIAERWTPFVDGDSMVFEQPIVWATARA